MFAEHVTERHLQVLPSGIFDDAHEAMKIVTRWLVVEAVLAGAHYRLGVREALAVRTFRRNGYDVRIGKDVVD